MEFEFEQNNSSSISYDDIKEKVAVCLGALFNSVLKTSIENESPIGKETAKNGGAVELVNQFVDYLSSPLKANYPQHPFSFRMASFKPSNQETLTGSDLVMTFEVFEKGNALPKISKATLIQAKCAVFVPNSDELVCYNSDLIEQLKTIDSLTPNDGFLMLFTDQGCFSLGAKEAIPMISNTTFKCKKQSLQDAGTIIAKLANCQKGNFPDISPVKLEVARKRNNLLDLDDLSKKLAAFGLENKPKIISVNANIK